MKGDQDEVDQPTEPKPQKLTAGSKENSPDKEESTVKESSMSPEKKKGKSSKDKLKYLEEKYLEIFKENSVRKEEMGRMESLIREMLMEIGVDFSGGESRNPTEDVSKYRSRFTDGWIKFRKRTEQEKHRAEEEAVSRQKTIIEGLQKMVGENGKRKEDAVREARAEVESQMHNMEEMNSKLQSDYNNLLGVLKSKEREISELKAANSILSGKEADRLIERFEEIEETGFENMLKKSSRVDDLIRLRNELEEAYSTIDELQVQISANCSPTRSEGQPAMVEKTNQNGKPRHFKSFECVSTQTDSLEDLKGGRALRQTSYLEERLEDTFEREIRQKLSSESMVGGNQEYLKNLVLRYLIFEAKGSENECAVMRRAILDVLKVSSEERATIDAAINNKGSIKDSVFFLRLFGGSK